MIRYFFYKYFELTFWIVALICLAFMNPADQSHFSLCPFKLLDITWCPGCGIGHAIAYLFRGDLVNSFHAHWLGVPAFAVIMYRIITLIINNQKHPANNFSR